MRVIDISFAAALCSFASASAQNRSAPTGEAYNISPKHLRTNDMVDSSTVECLDCNTHIIDTRLESSKKGKSKGKGKKSSSKSNKSGSPKGKGKSSAHDTGNGNLQDCGAKCSFDAAKKYEEAQQGGAADPSGVAEAAYNECLQNCLKEEMLEGTIA